MRKYQGESIYFTLKFNKLENKPYKNFKDFTKITVFWYTDGCHVVKHSNKSIPGYLLLQASSDGLLLTGNIPGNQTRRLAAGLLCADIRIETNDDIMIEKKSTKIVLERDLIKLELN